MTDADPHLDAEHIETLRMAMIARRAQLRDEIRAADARAELERQDRQAARVADTKDVAFAQMVAELGGADAQRDADEIAQIDRALARIAEGVYDECMVCGGPIGLARLTAFPAAVRCLDCQRDYERRHPEALAG